MATGRQPRKVVAGSKAPCRRESRHHLSRCQGRRNRRCRDRGHLGSWAQNIARHCGTKIATVALARRLERILFAMWRDQTEYQPTRVKSQSSKIRRNGVHVVDNDLTAKSSSWGSKHECGAWPLSRAVSQRVLLLLRIYRCAGKHVPELSANKG